MSAGHLLATPSTCKQLLDIFINGENDGFSNTGAIALSHIIKVNPQLFESVLEYVNMAQICGVLNDGSPRVQQAFMTMLNIALLNKNQRLLDCMGQEADLVLATLL